MRERLGVLSFACAAVLSGAGSYAALGQLVAFPGAEGFGANSTGGRNGDVYHVTNLNDSGAGSLRAGITGAPATGRTIVFDVGGTIRLQSNLTVNRSKVTIAGQTAPGPGITLTDYTFQVAGSSSNLVNNVIVRYIRSRKGDLQSSEDAIGVLGGGDTNNVIYTSDVILDHVSASWSEDEALSVTNHASNVTVQHSFITEALDAAGHAYGSLIRPQIDSNVSFNHNLYANQRSRNPRTGTYNQRQLNFDFRNNVVYNFSDRAGYAGGASETGDPTEFVRMNYVGNYVIAGPSTSGAETGFGSRRTMAFLKDTGGDPIDIRVYQAGNKIDSNSNAIRDGVDTGWNMFAASGPVAFPIADRLTSELAFPYATTDSADVAYAKVLASAGAFPWNRDAVDQRLATQVSTYGGSIVLTQPTTEWNNIISQPMVSRPAGFDTDSDGMPNFWETARLLNPNSSAGSNENNGIGPNGYTNLENYLNYLTLIANWRVNANGNWGSILNWAGAAPEAMDATANFGAVITAPRTVTVDAPKTVGQIAFDSVHSYTIAGTNHITMDVINGRGSIDVFSGNHTIAAPLALADDVVVNVMPAGSTLSVQNLQDFAAVLTKTGAGKLLVNRARGHWLNVQQGTVAVTPRGTSSSVSFVDILTIAPGGALDLADNDLVVQFGNFAEIRGQVLAGFGNPSVGITSSTSDGTQILALFDNALVGSSDWNGQTISASAIVGKYTYFGDVNLDGQVTGDDYAVVDSNLDTDPPVGIEWLSGDANLDGIVTGDDYATIDSNLGLGAGMPLAPSRIDRSAVPEPAGAVLLLASVWGISMRRRRGRCP